MNIEDRYQEALDYLYSFIDFSLQRTFRFSADKFDLGRMYRLVEALGNPHLSYRIIHVAGTKGKGSVSAMCASVLESAGYKVGLYTSPHLQEYTERIQINSSQISKTELVDLVDEIKPYVTAIPELTTFEITTGLAFWYFARHEVDIAVIEVGLGGRLDSTNVVLPDVSVITSLSYDHSEILGDTLAKIAAEKAGIIKWGVPVVLAPQKAEARLVVEEIAAQRGSPLYQVGRDWLFAPVAHSLQGQSLFIWSSNQQGPADAYVESGGSQEWEPPRIYISLLGYHQVENAATAYAALQILREKGVRINDSAIIEGFAAAKWPGRFEILCQAPIIVVDSAHNRDSALKLRLTLDDYFPGKKVILVFGASEDKDVSGMFIELMPRTTRVIATESIHPRAMAADQIVALAHQFGIPARAVLPLENALSESINSAGDETIILVTGSIFVAAGAREAWQKHAGKVLE